MTSTDSTIDHHTGRQWLSAAGIPNQSAGLDALDRMSNAGVDRETIYVYLDGLSELKLDEAQAGQTLDNLSQIVSAIQEHDLLDSDAMSHPEQMHWLLQVSSSSPQIVGSLLDAPDLIGDKSAFPDDLQWRQDLQSRLSETSDEEAAGVLHEFRRREMFRIARSEFSGVAAPHQVMRRLSVLAEVIVDSAIDTASHLLAQTFGHPVRPDGQIARFTAIAVGQLGGMELSYSSRIDLLFVCDDADKTRGPRRISGREYFQRFSELVGRLITPPAQTGVTYRIDMRMRPGDESAPLCSTLNDALRYYQRSGKTWDRQTLIKARPVGGDQDLGAEFLASMQPWIYRQFLNRADIAGIRHIKRRIERRARRVGDEQRNVLTGPGGINDIEVAIQFLQLLNGGDLTAIRVSNTLEAIEALSQVGCLTPQEASSLSENYLFLRQVEHGLQTLFDLETHTVPGPKSGLFHLCRHLNFIGDSPDQAIETFERKLADVQAINRRVLDHLLHDAFGDEEEIAVETELVLDPDPNDELISSVLSPLGFSDADAAYRLLMQLANEKIPFLSERRCRHFLAAIAPRLLPAVAGTPEPMQTLDNLVRVSDSLGGKSALWELASYTPATLDMVVRLSAVGPYLNGILTSNPGMIDELMDSLTLDRLPSAIELDSNADELCLRARDVARVLFSFRNSVHLRVGVRDILGKDDIQATHRTLSDCAETCLRKITEDQHEKLAARFGDPETTDGQTCQMVVVAIGKLGGQEPNYHSDLDLIFLYESEGRTRSRRGGRKDGTTNYHFFNQLSQRVCQVFNSVSPQGRLYHVDTKLRPSGGSSILAVPIAQLNRYFENDAAHLRERLALCKSRPVFGEPVACTWAMQTIREICQQGDRISSLGLETKKLRTQLEQDAAVSNIKRGIGGTMDVEMLVQVLQLKHARSQPQILQSNTLTVIEKLRETELLTERDSEILEEGYAFLRRVESGLRLLNTAARHDLPGDEDSLEQLVYLLQLGSSQELLESIKENRQRIRDRFDAVCRAN